jgi:hypothetical protein
LSSAAKEAAEKLIFHTTRPSATKVAVDSAPVTARLKRLLKKSSLLAIRPSATKVAVDNDALTARLKPCPFKDRANREFFSSL